VTAPPAWNYDFSGTQTTFRQERLETEKTEGEQIVALEDADEISARLSQQEDSESANLSQRQNVN